MIDVADLFKNSNEVFRPCKGWEDSYLVSNTGKVKSIDRVVIKRGKFVQEGKILTPDKANRVRLFKNGIGTQVRVEKLVFDVFTREEAYIIPVMEDMPDEEWAFCEGYEGLYQVSNMGRVRSLGRMSLQPDGTMKYKKGKLLKPFFVGKGDKAYYSVRLWKDCKEEKALVHRLVGVAFVPNPQPEKFNVCNHLDENKLNNRADNIEWTDEQGNIAYSLGKKVEEKKDGLVTRSFNSLSQAERETQIPRNKIRECCNGKVTDINGYTYNFV